MKNVNKLLESIENLRSKLYNEINFKDTRLTDKTVLEDSLILNEEINEYYKIIDKIRQRYSRAK
ncbi:Spo0E family sporulation regulatory protein-aspartic acid phosphatase [Clostridium felsineum]|uniref:Uncharacterized protein n=1 Tax=Clostridium felsineum TaxID=36839 RepID=A0A1S8KYM3_9CLOT|nr:Spo0E family sporulation regulatory protein-aspartic acid phosphatase [Clostridium felsineum]MCR3760763.1 Spo0E family sporulation regulatory protein-aspartic acid phosphatase [Clostridium felsineum]URZ03878.1 hypothetical protein CLAUR_039440 [Clostridium felsineum]URZ07846.1 hypothetical protein CLROS_032070 [Clostridium felsineum]URZ12877.1 hypothetical protein CROST_036220 [Clostridium felsineum]URZ15154.1 hypothetical protein CLFE_011720 [Clostridium felsineum DSM 794]